MTVQVSMQVSMLNFKGHSFGEKNDQLCVETGQINKKFQFCAPSAKNEPQRPYMLHYLCTEKSDRSFASDKTDRIYYHHLQLHISFFYLKNAYSHFTEYIHINNTS